MELSIYNVIKSPIISTKSIDVYRKFGQYTFHIHKKANKTMVKDAVKRLWSVEVEKVCVVSLPDKAKSFNRKSFTASGKKKAIVTLKKGYKIEIPGLFETVESQQQVAPEKK